MRFQLSRGNVLFLGTIGMALLALLFSLGLGPFPHSQVPDSQVPATLKSNIIVTENAHLGTSSWEIPPDKGADTQIQTYTSATSVSPGQKLTFYVSTKIEGTLYSISIYRLGWYGGLGGRLMSFKAGQIGHAQGYYDPSTNRLVGCNSCRVNTQTGPIEAHWQRSYTLTVPSGWTTGVYLAKFTDANNMQTYAPFDVRGKAPSTYVVVTADTTYQAYNNWGGHSLYKYNSHEGSETTSIGQAVKVSFDRPYIEGHGSGQVLDYEADAIHWLERQGYDLSYTSGVDLHEDPAQLLQHRAYLSLGHDEYWTKEMRDGVEYARNHGVGLAFLGADASFWQMRFELDSAGVPNRTIVCYKVEAGHHPEVDPFYGRDKTRVTALWRDPVLNRPENAMIGIMFSDLTRRQNGFPWQVSSLAKSPLLDGTGLQPGQQYGCSLVGYEWDRVFANGATPAGLQVLAESHTVNDSNTPNTSNTTYYIAPSGAMVFATGSIYWTYSLDFYRYSRDPKCVGQNLVVPGMQKLMAHVMDALVINHPRSS